MNVSYPDRRSESFNNLTVEDVKRETDKAIEQGASRIEITSEPNRKERRQAKSKRRARAGKGKR